MKALTEHLESRSVPFELVEHEQAYTSIDEALSLGLSADEVLKVVVLDTGQGHALVVVPGSRRLHMKQVLRAVGDKHARLAGEDEIERDFPGYKLGAIPPLGSLFGIPTYVDPEVMEHETVVFAAGTQTQSVRVRTEDLFRDEPATIVPVTRHTEGRDEVL